MLRLNLHHVRAELQKFLLLTLCLLFGLTGYADNGTLKVSLEKEGQLSKYIKKGDVLNIASLAISGPINNDDLGLIFSMSNLEDLDLSDAVLSKEKYDIKKGRDFYDGSTLKLVELSKLKKLITSKKYYNLANISSLPQLKYLAVFDSDLDRRFIEENITLSLDTIALLSSTPLSNQSSKYNELNLEKYTAKYDLENYADRLSSPIKTRVLISEVEGMAYVDHRNIAANIIKIPDYTILYNWSPNLSEQEIESVDVLAPFSYVGADITQLKIPSKVRKLPSYLVGVSKGAPLSVLAKFNNPEWNDAIAEMTKECDEDVKDYIMRRKYPLYSKINEIELENIEDIDAYALDGCVIHSLILPPTLKYFHQKAFENNYVLEAHFTSDSAPIVYDGAHNNTSSYLSDTWTKFIVPKGKIDKFRIGPWGTLISNSYWSACLFEDGQETVFSFNIEKPGSLNKFITDDNALKIEKLTLSGILYDTDFATINKCKNLRYLDLRNTFPCLSPETIKKNKKSQEALMGLLGLAFEGAAADTKAKFETGQGSSIEAAYYDALSKKYQELMKADTGKSVKADPNCKLPEKAFDGLRFLVAIAYPSQLQTLTNGSLSSKIIQEVILPSSLIKLNAHIGSPRLISINIPPTVNEIGGYVFNGSSRLEELDLRNTQVETIAWSSLYKCPNLTNFYGSPVLKSFKRDNYSENPQLNVGWFYTKEKPSGLDYFQIIHVPEGYSAGYSGLHCTVIDDIKE